jgi:MFS family permease
MAATFALAASWPVVLLGKLVAWFGKGIRGPLRNAMLAESIPEQHRGKAFGFHRAGDTLGAVVGPLLGAALAAWVLPWTGDDATAPIRSVFWWAVLPGLGSAVVFALLVREAPEHTAPVGRKFLASITGLPAEFRRFLIGVGVFGAGDFSPTLLILAATQLLEPGYGTERAVALAALLYALRNGVQAAASFPVGALSDRHGRRGLLTAGYALGALVAVGFAAAFHTVMSSLAGLAILFASAGIFMAVQEALEGAMTADLVAEKSLRGTAYGVLGTVNGVGDLISSVLVGVLWWAFGPIPGFLFAAVLMLCGTVLLYRWR